MGKRKNKNKSNTPRHKRLKREGRLQAAKHWIPKYTGKNLVNGYSKHFGVNKLNAVRELGMIGYTYEETYIQELKDAEIQKQMEAEKRNAAKRQLEEDLWNEDTDETFAFIAGYTAGGAPFGITWEEQEQEEEKNNDPIYKQMDKSFDIADDDLPF